MVVLHRKITVIAGISFLFSFPFHHYLSSSSLSSARTAPMKKPAINPKNKHKTHPIIWITSRPCRSSGALLCVMYRPLKCFGAVARDRNLNHLALHDLPGNFVIILIPCFEIVESVSDYFFPQGFCVWRGFSVVFVQIVNIPRIKPR